MTGYLVHFNPLGGDEQSEMVNGADVLSLEVEVECDVMYEFKVQAVNAYGQGQNSSTVQAKCSELVAYMYMFVTVHKHNALELLPQS